MKNFKVIVVRTEEYEVDVDENIFDEKAMEEFNRDFYEVGDSTGHVKNIIKFFISEEAQFFIENGHLFIEGYGVITINKKEEEEKAFININCKDNLNLKIDVKEIK